MITPSFGLTATERVLPKLALDFTTATLDPRVTFTRSGNTATYTNSSGVITAINANLPRFDYNPTTLVCQGLLIEEARTNIVLNSLIDGTILNTQIVTTSATAYTLSFYGTGSIVLTGTHSATVTGTGAYPSRKTYTFTPTAGALTLTVSGTVQYAQLETGSFATSFIPTSVASVTRNADIATMTGTNFSSWFNASEGTLEATAAFKGFPSTSNPVSAALSDNIGNNYIVLFEYNNRTRLQTEIKTNGVIQTGLITLSSISTDTFYKQSVAYKTDNVATCSNASTVQTDTSVTLPTVNQLNIGNLAGGNYTNGWVKYVSYYPQRMINAEVQAITK